MLGAGCCFEEGFVVFGEVCAFGVWVFKACGCGFRGLVVRACFLGCFVKVWNWLGVWVLGWGLGFELAVCGLLEG